MDRGRSLLEDALVRRAQSGDRAAIDQVLRILAPVIQAFFRARIGRASETDDLVQNTLLRVHRGLPDLRNPGSVKAFTLKAALFELQDLYRGRYRLKESLLHPEYGPEVDERIADPEQRIDLDRALSALSPKARRIIELREYGYRYTEIARMLETTEAAVKMQVKRGFEKLRHLLVSVLLLLQLEAAGYFFR